MNLSSTENSIKFLRDYLNEYRRGNDRVILSTNRPIPEHSLSSCCTRNIVKGWNNTIKRTSSDSSVDEVRLSILHIKGISFADYLLAVDMRQGTDSTPLRVHFLTNENIDEFLSALVCTNHVYDHTGSHPLHSHSV